MTQTLVENLYVTKLINGTVATQSCSNYKDIEWLVVSPLQPTGKVEEIVRISVLNDIDLQPNELSFDYAQSMN